MGRDGGPHRALETHVVTQTSTDATDYRFPLLIADEGSFEDLEISAKFKAVSGEVDRAAGLVFRLKDANNYYIVRANALEDNYRLYRVVAGNVRSSRERTSKSRRANGMNCASNASETGSSVTTTAPKKSKRPTTRSEGQARSGCGTKADSVTYFDDLKVVVK